MLSYAAPKWSSLITLIAHPAPYCPKATVGHLNFGPQRWSFPVVEFSLTELCPSLCELYRCPTLWRSPYRWCSHRPLCSVWDTLRGAQLKMLTGPWFQTVPYNQTYRNENVKNRKKVNLTGTSNIQVMSAQYKKNGGEEKHLHRVFVVHDGKKLIYWQNPL